MEINMDDPIVLRLKELERETDFEFVVELIDIYLNETPKLIEKISSTLAEKKHSDLTIAAHTLKGSSLNIGAKKLGALCLKLEELGRSGKPLPPEISTNEIEIEFERTKNVLEKYKIKNI